MPFLIDGHNLIPKIPGLNLGLIDDEDRLVKLLQEYCRLHRKEAVVFFDNAPPGFSRKKKYGNLTVHYVRQGRTADQAIAEKLAQLGRSARNWSVVSSDRAVQASAREAKAKVIPAETFSALLSNLDKGNPTHPISEDSLSVQEVEEWLNIFRKK
jgi:hypothetical protein